MQTILTIRRFEAVNLSMSVTEPMTAECLFLRRGLVARCGNAEHGLLRLRVPRSDPETPHELAAAKHSVVCATSGAFQSPWLATFRLRRELIAPP